MTDLSHWWNARFASTAPPRPATLPHHVGLWLDRGLPWPSVEDRTKSARGDLYRVAIAALEHDAPARTTYTEVLRRVVDRTPLSSDRRIFHLRTSSRVLLHTASNASVTDGAILLHHTYGVPYLPGSALKGVLRASLRGLDPAVQAFWLGQGGADDRDDDQAAALDLHDALWCPAPSDPTPLALDIVNPHHPDYYSKNAPPLDTDDPVPTHRLSLRPGTCFRAVLEHSPALPRATIDALCERFIHALTTLGVGAWTTSGYGRLAVTTPADDGHPS
jgi:CRISPR-associated protein Cmr6